MHPTPQQFVDAARLSVLIGCPHAYFNSAERDRLEPYLLAASARILQLTSSDDFDAVTAIVVAEQIARLLGCDNTGIAAEVRKRAL